MVDARILICDPLAPEGVAVLERAGLELDTRPGLSPEELQAIVGDYDAVVVRSATKVRAPIIEAAARLKLIGRAGIGVDNVDVPDATRAGIIVMNCPGGPKIAVAEHTFALILAVTRRVAEATASLKAGRWDKKKLKGREIHGKTLGVIGLGNIGRAVAEHGLAWGMKVVGFDPYVSNEALAGLDIEGVTLDELWSRADVLALHVPLTEETRHLVDADAIAQMKPGSFLVSCARGGVVDEMALYDALKSGHLAGAALDVFETEPAPADHPLFTLDTFACSPHIGSATPEAQGAIAVMLAEQMVLFFEEGTIKNAVNAPPVTRALLDRLGRWLGLANRLGAFVGQLLPGDTRQVTITYTGALKKLGTAPLTEQVLTGLMSQLTDDTVNPVNAATLARDRGIELVTSLSDEHPGLAATVGVRVEGDGVLEVVGTVFERREPRIVRLDGGEIDAVPDGHIIVLRNEDVPKVIGQVGMQLGEAGINIGHIHLARNAEVDRAVSLINIDSPAPPELLARLAAIPHVTHVAQIEL